MATIKSQMALDDGMSRVLSKIVNGLNTTLDAFEQVQRASGSALDVANIEAARAGLAEAGAEVKAMEDYFRQAAEQEERLNNGVNQGASAMDGLLSKAASLAATYMSISALKGFATGSMEAADTQIGAQVQLRTVLDNMGATDVYAGMEDAITGTALESTLTLNTAEAEGNYGAFAAGITGNPLELQVDTSNAMSAYDAITQKAAGIQSRGMFGDEVMIAGAAELATYFSDTEAILSMMDTLTNYAAGMSNGQAVDASAMVDYATNLGKIMSGSFDAMKDRGFEFTDTQKAIIDGTATEQQIIAGLGAEYLSLSSDMQAAAVIQSVINEGWSGMYEAMSGTPTGSITQLNNALGDIQENVGGWYLSGGAGPRADGTEQPPANQRRRYGPGHGAGLWHHIAHKFGGRGCGVWLRCVRQLELDRAHCLGGGGGPGGLWHRAVGSQRGPDGPQCPGGRFQRIENRGRRPFCYKGRGLTCGGSGNKHRCGRTNRAQRRPAGLSHNVGGDWCYCPHRRRGGRHPIP